MTNPILDTRHASFAEMPNRNQLHLKATPDNPTSLTLSLVALSMPIQCLGMLHEIMRESRSGGRAKAMLSIARQVGGVNLPDAIATDIAQPRKTEAEYALVDALTLDSFISRRADCGWDLTGGRAGTPGLWILQFERAKQDDCIEARD